MKKLVLFSLVTLLVFGCAKYPDGGLHAFMKKNMIGTWKLNSYYLNNFDYSDTVFVQNLQETFSEGGGFSRNARDLRGASLRSPANPNLRYIDVGVRLIRTRP